MELLIALAPHLEDFVAGLFQIRAEVRALAARHHELAPLYACKRLFVQRRAQRAHKPEEAAGFDAAALEAALVERFGEPLTELAFARHVMAWLDAEAANAEALDLAVRYAGLGAADGGRPGQAWPRHTVQGAAQDRSAAPAADRDDRASWRCR